MTKFIFISCGVFIGLMLYFVKKLSTKSKTYYRAKKCVSVNNPKSANKKYNNQAKPPWVIEEVIRLKAIMGEKVGCRKVAYTFNRLYGDKQTVGKSFVAKTISKHRYQIMRTRQDIKGKLPREVACNHTWAMDLSFYTLPNQSRMMMLGILDHGSRKLLSLQQITTKSSWYLLGWLCFTIAKYGKPKKLRTDNEVIFTGYVFTRFLRLVNIEQQKIPVASPWCNGRIERLFATLKPVLKIHYNLKNIKTDTRGFKTFLCQFKYWYNCIRPHQNLKGKTPDEVWNKRE